MRTRNSIRGFVRPLVRPSVRRGDRVEKWKNERFGYFLCKFVCGGGVGWGVDGVGVRMGVECPCPPVRNDIVTPRHLFLHFLYLTFYHHFPFISLFFLLNFFQCFCPFQLLLFLSSHYSFLFTYPFISSTADFLLNVKVPIHTFNFLYQSFLFLFCPN